MILVVMGVSGVGKTTLGKALAAALRCDFVEGDDYHARASIEKMGRGEPLGDADRRPWLDRLHGVVADYAARGRDAVLACSALKRSYRERLVGEVAGVRFILLSGDPDRVRQRLVARAGHYMPPQLLASQLADLQTPDDAIVVPLELPTAGQVDLALRALAAGAGR